VLVLDCDQVLGWLLDDLAAVAATDDANVLTHVADRLLDRVRVGLFDLLSLPRIGERPRGRYGLRGAENAVDPTATAAIGASAPKPPPRLRMATFHERNEVLAAHWRVRPDAEPFKRP
jgi:hypothetical protein